MQRELARTPKVLRHRPNILAIQVEMTQPAVFAIAHQQQRLFKASVDSEPVAAIQQSSIGSFPRKASPVVPIPIELEDSRIAVSVGDENGTVRCGNCCCQPPLVR